MRMLQEFGLGYIKFVQSATTLRVGEAQSVKLSKAQDAFEADGTLKDAKVQQMLEAEVASLLSLAKAVQAAKPNG